MPTSSPKGSPPWLDLTLGILTAPVLLGLVVADRAGRWLRDLDTNEQSLWMEQRLPPLTVEQVAQRQKDQMRDQENDQTPDSDPTPLDPSPSDIQLTLPPVEDADAGQ
ncbi:MAG: hypothetical protein HC924_08410 [Synechococcaceae cyanobacterium SM2_3_2]|nr:hypothetical protein [Synechococcaceae cyanobacterium SM2_3_2]